MNDVNTQLGVSQQVTPLDGVLGSSFVRHGGKMAIGFRLARVLTRRLTAEITVDYSPTGARAADAVAGGFATTRATFVTAMRPLIGSAAANAFSSPFTTNSSVGLGTGGELVTIGALRFALTPVRRLTPFVVGGAGMASRSGALPAARIDGDYSAFFGFPGCVCALRERDEVRVHVTTPSRGMLGMMGAGVDYQPSLRFWRGSPQNRSRWGIRVDARVYLGATESETFVDTRPTSVIGQAHEDNLDYPYTGVLVVGTGPSAQFSNNRPRRLRIDAHGKAAHELSRVLGPRNPDARGVDDGRVPPVLTLAFSDRDVGQSVPGFQGSRVPGFQGSKVPRF